MEWGTTLFYALAVDGLGDAYVVGATSSPNLPVTANAVQPTYAGYTVLPFEVEQLIGDGFVAQVNPAGTALLYLTYLGGSNNDVAYALAVDSAGLIYVTGSTDSVDFPTTSDAFQFNWRGDGGQADTLPVGDGFFTIINPSSKKARVQHLFWWKYGRCVRGRDF